MTSNSSLVNVLCSAVADCRLIAQFYCPSPVLVVRDGGQRRVEAVDVKCHVALVTQQLHVSVLFAAAHAAGAETTLGLRVGLAVFALRPTLPCSQGGRGNIYARTYFPHTLEN